MTDKNSDNKYVSRLKTVLVMETRQDGKEGSKERIKFPKIGGFLSVTTFRKGFRHHINIVVNEFGKYKNQ